MPPKRSKVLIRIPRLAEQNHGIVCTDKKWIKNDPKGMSSKQELVQVKICHGIYLVSHNTKFQEYSDWNQMGQQKCYNIEQNVFKHIRAGKDDTKPVSNVDQQEYQPTA